MRCACGVGGGGWGRLGFNESGGKDLDANSASSYLPLPQGTSRVAAPAAPMGTTL